MAREWCGSLVVRLTATRKKRKIFLYEHPAVTYEPSCLPNIQTLFQTLRKFQFILNNYRC